MPMGSQRHYETGINGSHYDLPIQPIDYAMVNKLDACQFSVVKYITRFRRKNGKEDLLKARYFIDKLIKDEYGEEDTGQDKDNGVAERKEEARETGYVTR